jgi:hypothetical protein
MATAAANRSAPKPENVSECDEDMPPRTEKVAGFYHDLVVIKETVSRIGTGRVETHRPNLRFLISGIGSRD